MYDMRHLDKFHALEVHASAAMKAFLVFDKAGGVGGDPCGAITQKRMLCMSLALAPVK